MDSLEPALKPRRWRVLATAVCLLGSLALGYAFWPPSPPAPQATTPTRVAHIDDNDIADPAIVNPGYIGPQACAECHAKRVADLQTTQHFRACREPRADEMPVGFQPGKGSIPTRTPGFRYEMLKRGDDFIHASVTTTPKGEVRTEAKIGWVYGSAPADEVYHLWRGDRLYEAKVAWLHPFNEWGYTTFSPHAPGDHSRDTTTRCVECHNTWLAHVPGTTNQYLEPNRILGVTCESCHGPGREHATYHKAHPDEKASHGIAHPGKMERERHIEVCTQCHSNASKPRGPAFSYRPGEPLEAALRTASSKNPEEDHVANQVKYLRQSKCFTNSDSMTCTTCHNPHKPTDHSTLEQSCAKCHQPENCKDRPNQPLAVQNQCTACHMPPRVWMNVHFHTQDDEYKPPVKRHEHRIAVHPEAKDAVMWKYYRSQTDLASKAHVERLTKNLADYWLGEADRRGRDFRYLAEVGALREIYQYDPSPALREKIRVAAARQAKLDADWSNSLQLIEDRKTPEAISLLDSILKIKPDHAQANGKLGRLRAEIGQPVAAEKHLRAVAENDPNDAYGLNLLGWIAYLDNRHEDAIRLYRQALPIEPYSSEIRTRIGLANLKLEKWAEAAEAFRAAIGIDPKNVSAIQGLAHSLRMQKQPAEAVRYARRAAQLTEHRHLDILITLAGAYGDAGRFDDALTAANEALAIAKTSNPQMELTIRTTIENYKRGTN